MQVSGQLQNVYLKARFIPTTHTSHHHWSFQSKMTEKESLPEPTEKSGTGSHEVVSFSNCDTTPALDLSNADEALDFLTNHPRATELSAEAASILEDPAQRRRLVRKIDLTIAPLLAVVYFLQYMDKTTLSYAAVMGIRKDTSLQGQEYSDLSMLFYIGMVSPRGFTWGAGVGTDVIANRVFGSGVSDSVSSSKHL